MAIVPAVDPNVRVPPAVAAVAARAEEAQKAHIQALQGESGPAPEPAPAAPAEPSSDVKMDPAPAPAPPTDQPSPAAPAPIAETGPGSWEQRYKSESGRFKAQQQEVQQLRSTLDTQAQRIEELERLLARMQSAPAPAPQGSGVQAPRLLSEEEVNDYGQPFLDVVGKKAKEELLPEVESLKREVATLKQGLGQTREVVDEVEEGRLRAWMAHQLPIWDDINHAQEFHDWLKLPDPYSGSIRHTMLKEAWARREAPRVLSFFTGFLRDQAATDPQGQPTAPAATGKVPLETLAAPGRATTAAAQPPAEKPTFTRAQIAQFYTDVSTGKYRGREAERIAIDAQIIEAGAEGRIR